MSGTVSHSTEGELDGAGALLKGWGRVLANSRQLALIELGMNVLQVVKHHVECS